MTVAGCAAAVAGAGVVCADASVAAQRKMARDRFFTRVLSLGEILVS